MLNNICNLSYYGFLMHYILPFHLGSPYVVSTSSSTTRYPLPTNILAQHLQRGRNTNTSSAASGTSHLHNQSRAVSGIPANYNSGPLATVSTTTLSLISSATAGSNFPLKTEIPFTASHPPLHHRMCSHHPALLL